MTLLTMRVASVSVLGWLYPVVTVLLARRPARTARPDPARGGVVGALAGVVLIGAG